MPIRNEAPASAFKHAGSRPFVLVLSRALPLLFCVLAGAGCDRLSPPEPAPADAPEKAKAAPEAVPSAAPSVPMRYGVPFAWETSPDEPLAKARDLMAEVLRSNAAFVGSSAKRLAALPDAEQPRATVVACSDSHVQAAAWDESPEGDVFTVRNIGNQISSALGSVQYGVEHLHTPVLMVLGHTGCGAVQSVLAKSPTLPQELDTLKLPPARSGAGAEQAWTEAVVANVHAQVTQAVQQFGALVHSGELTVVGAVYDVRDGLGGGHGRLHVVNVNTNIETSRVEAFVKAVRVEQAPAKSSAPATAAEERIRAIIERTERSMAPGAVSAAHRGH